MKLMKREKNHDHLNESEMPVDHEFLSSYFDLLKFLFNGCGAEVNDEFIEGSVLPRLLALKMIVRQFESANPSMSKEMDQLVDELRGIFKDDPGIDEFFNLMNEDDRAGDEDEQLSEPNEFLKSMLS